MAKTDGTQNIPSELLDTYRATLGEEKPGDVVGKRYPYRVPRMQNGHGNVTATQRIQRDKFKYVIDKFKGLSAAERARWYAAMPPWSSLLWYYNFFMLSGLIDVLGANAKGASVIKSIQNISDSIPTGGKTVTIPNAVDTSKVVIMIWGSAHNWNFEEPIPDNFAAYAWNIFPVWSNLTATSIWVGWSETPQFAATVSLQIIEYI